MSLGHELIQPIFVQMTLYYTTKKGKTRSKEENFEERSEKVGGTTILVLEKLRFAQ